MKLWKNLSNRLDAVADVMAAKPCMQGCVGKTLLSIPRTPGNLITAVILAIGLLITIGRFGFRPWRGDQPGRQQPLGHLDRL